MKKIVSFALIFFTVAGLVWLSQLFIQRAPRESNVAPTVVGFETYIQRAEEQLAQKNYLVALDWYKQAAQVEPQNSFVREQMGLIYQKKNNFTDAIQEYQFALAAGSSKAPELYKTIADLYLQHNEWEKAEEQYRKAIEFGWKDKEVYLSLGKAYLWLSLFPAAKESFGKALELKEDFIEGRYYFSLVGCLDNLEYARIDMEKVKNYTPQTEEEKQIVADAAVMLTYIFQAQQPQQHDWAGVYLAKGFNSIGVPTLALAVVAPVIEKHTDYPQAYIFLGRANYLVQKYTEAEQAFDRYLELAGDQDPVLWFYVGDTDFAAGHPDAAITAYQRAIALDSGAYRALYTYKLAQVYEAKTNFEQAAIAYEEVTELDVTNKKAWLKVVGLSILELNDREKALRVAQKAFSLFPDDVEIVNSLGWAYLEQNDLVHAEEVLRKAQQIDPDFAPIYFNFGQMYKVRLDAEKAKEMYLRALNLDVGGGISKRAEEELKNLSTTN